MAYLNKVERKQQIVDAAKNFVLTEGLNQLTVRKLAEKADFSVGQVHHHFDSIHDLKAQVFLDIVYENLNLNHLAQTATYTEQLVYLLGSEASVSEKSYVRVWNDAESNAQSHPIFKDAYVHALDIWKNSIIDVLKFGLEVKEFHFKIDQINEVALRFIALAIGLEYLSNLQVEGVDAHFFHQQILLSIQHELHL